MKIESYQLGLGDEEEAHVPTLVRSKVRWLKHASYLVLEN